MLDKLNLKYLVRAHTIIGLFSIFLFYLSSYFGSVTFFLPYISQWELPSSHIEKSEDYKFNIDEKLDEIVKKYKLNEKDIEIKPPSFRDPRVSIAANNQSTIYLNPNTNEELDTFYEFNNISEFMNEIHFGDNIPVIGRFLMGVVSTLTIFLIISAILLFIYNKKKKKEKVTAKRSFFKWHKNLGLIVIPFLLIFVITGAFIGLMLNTSSVFALSATNYKESNLRKLVAPILFSQRVKLKDEIKEKASLPLSTLYEITRENFEKLHVTGINIYNYNKQNSQTMFRGYLFDNRALTGEVNRVGIILNSVDGSVISKIDLDKKHGVSTLLSGFYFLHFLPDETVFIRFVFFILGIGVCFCLAFGYLIWAQKKINKNTRYTNFLNRSALSIIVGTIPASALLFLLHWIIPFEYINRDILIKGLFYIYFLGLFIYSFYEGCVSKIIKNSLFMATLFLIAAIFLHGFFTEIYIWDSFFNKLDVIFFVDLCLFIIALFFVYLAIKIDDKFLSDFNYKRSENA